MSYINKGRPVEGLEKRSVVRNVRLEPFLDDELTLICSKTGISRSEAIRQSIMLYIDNVKKRLNEKGESV